jgi:hypothetical protein
MGVSALIILSELIRFPEEILRTILRLFWGFAPPLWRPGIAITAFELVILNKNCTGNSLDIACAPQPGQDWHKRGVDFITLP